MTKESKKTRKYSRIDFDTKLIIYALYSERYYANMTCKEIANCFNISVSSFYHIKKEIEKNNN